MGVNQLVRDNVSQIFIILLLTLTLADIGLMQSQNNLFDSELLDETQLKIITNTHNTSIAIFNNSQLASAASEGTGTKEDPYILSDYHITDEFGKDLIYIENTSDWVKISNSTLANGTNGIRLKDVQNVIIQNNTISKNTENGIKVTNSTNVMIYDSDIFHNGIGCTEGIQLYSHSGSGGYFNPSVDIVVENNMIHDNYRDGITVHAAINMNITGNVIEDNGGWCETAESYSNYHSSNGIDMYNGTNVIVKYNNFTHNSLYGIKNAEHSSSVNTTLNNFFLNGHSILDSQAYDDGTSNTFISNFWSDLSTGEVYNISGDANNQDINPCSQPIQFGDETCPILSEEEVSTTTIFDTTTTTSSTTTVETKGISVNALFVSFAIIAVTLYQRKKTSY